MGKFEKFKKKLGDFHFDTKYLTKLTESRGSCVDVQTTSQHVCMRPFQFHDFKNSLKSVLSEGIAKYNKSLNGILFGYTNMKLLTDVGIVSDDSPYVHFDVEADFFIFKPTVGNQLQGVVNKKSKDHVGCLVHNTFNISLPKPENCRSWLGSSVHLNSQILFKIDYTNFDRKLPYIRGEILSVLSDDSGISTGEEGNVTKKNKRTIFYDDETSTEDVPDVPKEKDHKKRKHRSKKMEEDLLEIDNIMEKQGKKKQLKSKQLSSSDDNLNISEIIVNISEVQKEKHRKKRKRRSMEIEESLSETDNIIEMPVKRKRCKSEQLFLSDTEISEMADYTKPKKKKHEKKNKYEDNVSSQECVDKKIKKRRSSQISQNEINVHESDTNSSSKSKRNSRKNRFEQSYCKKELVEGEVEETKSEFSHSDAHNTSKRKPKKHRHKYEENETKQKKLKGELGDDDDDVISLPDLNLEEILYSRNQDNVKQEYALHTSIDIKSLNDSEDEEF